LLWAEADAGRSIAGEPWIFTAEEVPLALTAQEERTAS
jgi:hypothetical protein